MTKKLESVIINERLKNLLLKCKKDTLGVCMSSDEKVIAIENVQIEIQDWQLCTTPDNFKQLGCLMHPCAQSQKLNDCKNIFLRPMKYKLTSKFSLDKYSPLWDFKAPIDKRMIVVNNNMDTNKKKIVQTDGIEIDKQSPLWAVVDSLFTECRKSIKHKFFDSFNAFVKNGNFYISDLDFACKNIGVNHTPEIQICLKKLKEQVQELSEFEQRRYKEKAL